MTETENYRGLRMKADKVGYIYKRFSGKIYILYSKILDKNVNEAICRAKLTWEAALVGERTI